MDINAIYRKKLIALIPILVFMVVLSFLIGKYSIKPGVFFQSVMKILTGDSPSIPKEIYTVIVRIRVPRIIAAVLVGSALSVSGCAYQALFQNPMVSPDILGASQGAGFGAALGLLMMSGYFMTSFLSFCFGIGAVFLTYIIATRFRIDRTLGLVLSGIMISSLFSSSLSFIKLIADTENTLPAITYWLMGSLASIQNEDLKFIIFPIFIATLVIYKLRWQINIMTMGEVEAKSLGLNTKALRLAVIIAATLNTAACVSVSGMIGWIGLVIPHFSRMYIGNDYRYVIPSSILMGAIFMLFVDNFSRNLYTVEIPLGILMSFVGAPMFIYLIIKRGRDI